VRQRDPALVAAGRLLDITPLLVDRPDQPETLDLAPAIPAPGEEAEGFAGEILTFGDLSLADPNLGEILGRECDELAVAHLASGGDRLAQQVLGKRDVAPVE
jgi:hypothetical protein